MRYGRIRAMLIERYWHNLVPKLISRRSYDIVISEHHGNVGHYCNFHISLTIAIVLIMCHCFIEEVHTVARLSEKMVVALYGCNTHHWSKKLTILYSRIVSRTICQRLESAVDLQESHVLRLSTPNYISFRCETCFITVFRFLR